MARPKKPKLKGIILHEGQTAVWDVCKVQPSRPEYTKLWVNPATNKLCWGQNMPEPYDGQDVHIDAKEFTLPYEVGERVYLREPWMNWIDHYVYKDSPEANNVPKWMRAAHMPEAAARKFAVCTGVEAVRCQSVNYEQLVSLNIATIGILKMSIIRNHGQHAWDDNVYIFISTFKPE